MRPWRIFRVLYRILSCQTAYNRGHLVRPVDRQAEVCTVQKVKRLHLPKNTLLITRYTAYLKYFSVSLIFLLYLIFFNYVSSAELNTDDWNNSSIYMG